MANKNLETKLLNYLHRLPTQKQSLVLGVAREMAINEEEINSPLIEANLKELDKRWIEFKKGNAKPIKWQKAKNDLMNKLKQV
jgi:hypothetical protein